MASDPTPVERDIMDTLRAVYYFERVDGAWRPRFGDTYSDEEMAALPALSVPEFEPGEEITYHAHWTKPEGQLLTSVVEGVHQHIHYMGDPQRWRSFMYYVVRVDDVMHYTYGHEVVDRSGATG